MPPTAAAVTHMQLLVFSQRISAHNATRFVSVYSTQATDRYELWLAHSCL